MQRAVAVKREASKMSACSDLAEHIWNASGSCQNRFCPRHFHQLQAQPLGLGGGGGLLQELNGIGGKAESATLEDDGVISLPYSKPTIAVKPTMINTDASDAWADENLSADVPQISKRTTPGKHILLKPAEQPRRCIDSSSNNVVRKPLIQNTPSDCSLHSPQDPLLAGPSCPGSRVERNIPFQSRTFPGDMVAQEDGAEMPSREKPNLPLRGLCHKSPVISDRTGDCAIDSVEYPSILQRGEALLSEKAGLSLSPDSEGEGGEYCSIVDYSGQVPTHQGLSYDRTKVAWPESEMPIPKFLGQDTAGNTRTKSRVVNFSEGGSRVLNSDSAFQREKHSPHDSACNHFPSETEGLAFPSDTVLKSKSPFAVAQGNYCRPLARELDDTEGKHIKNISSSVEQKLSCPLSLLQNEPIYAESTKRKKGQLNNSKTHPRNGALACSPCKDQADGPWRERTLNLNGEREFQDSATQVAATITIMAAHTEEHNRTIFLSSPDSAVGVQWPCVSPTSHPETGKTSPFFELGEGPQMISQISSRGSSSGLQSQMSGKNVMDESPAIPPKLSKGSPLGGERPLAPSVSSGTCDGPEHVGVSRNDADGLTSGPSSFICAPGNRSSPEEPSRGSSSSSSEGRHKYYNLAWSKQCRIEEEEEEEQGFPKRTQETERVENGAISPLSTSHHPQGGKCSVQENKKGGMSKSASFAFEFPRDKNGTEEFAPPPPPPKKQSRHFFKMNKSSSELEKLNSDSTENLNPPFQGIHITFRAGSTDSLNLDTNMFSNGGPPCKTSLHSPTRTGKQISPLAHFPACPNKDRPHCSPLQPPPLPQKKTVSRAVSSPDGFYWGPTSPARAAIPTNPKLNFSQSESNVCAHEGPAFSSSLGPNHRTFSSSESLEKAFRGSPSPFPHSGRNGNNCTQNKNVPSRSVSQHSMSTQVPSGSSLRLHSLLSNIDNKEGVYAKLGGLYAESLRRLVSKCEDCFMRDQKSELHFSENTWSLFKLTCNKPCCDSGDAIYYCATCSKDPSSTYAVKICKSQDTKAATSCCSPSVPVHFNIQQDCGHFVASVPSSMLKSPSGDSQCPSGAATEQDCVVVITREVPHQTAADFVRGSGPFHKAKPEVYERRVCFLLLQLCNGLEHLKEHNIIHRDLCLENLLLVHCRPPPACSPPREDKHLPRLIISNFLKAKQKSGTAESKAKKDQARLAPEIVSASQYKKFDEFQTGILIYELLHQPNPFEVKAHLREQEYSQGDLPPLPNLSIYSRGLQQLAHLLLEADPIKRIHITEAKLVLQCLLWGPRKDLMDQPLNHEEALHSALHNWTDMKRALLMMKFAERAVDADRKIELEDWLCCQYLASADSSSLSKALKLLQLL